MVLEEMSAIYNPWSYLQQPAHPASGLNASFRTLLAAIDLGWEVIEPIHVQSEERSDRKSFHFLLTHPTLGKMSPFIVFGTSEVEQFVCTYGYQTVGDAVSSGCFCCNFQ